MRLSDKQTQLRSPIHALVAGLGKDNGVSISHDDSTADLSEAIIQGNSGGSWVDELKGVGCLVAAFNVG